MSMVRAHAEEVWETMHGRLGDDLRAVTRFESTTFDTVMREDLRTGYATHEKQALVDAVIIDHLGIPELQAAFKAGRLAASIRVFDDAWVCSWPDPAGRKSGFIVSVQRGGDATLADVESCLSYLDERFGSDEVRTGGDYSL